MRVSRVSRVSRLFALALVPTLAAAAPKKAGKAAPEEAGTTAMKAKSLGPCGAKILPLVEGNEWTYAQVASPAEPTDQIKRLSPKQPKTIVITVKSVEQKKGADTVVTLEEKVTTQVVPPPDKDNPTRKEVLDERTVTSTITCNGKTKFEISPEAFFFAGEPGGYLGLSLDKVDRSHDTSWKLTNGGVGDAEWREEIVAHWTRVPADGSTTKGQTGKLELERKFTPQVPEDIVTKLGRMRAEKLALLTTGRVTLDGAIQLTGPQELPAGWLTTLWATDSVGVVQVINAYSHAYQLVDAKLH